MVFLKNLFNAHKNEYDAHLLLEEDEPGYQLKEQGIEHILGKAHYVVGKAVPPIDMGGPVAIYYFREHVAGTGFATMKISYPDENRDKTNRLGAYELVAFTKETYNTSAANTNFNIIERRICGNLTSVGYCSKATALNPGDTCELPTNENKNRYLIFDSYTPGGKKFMIGDREHHLLLCMEIFKEELDYARANNSVQLFNLLKQQGVYPYSDLNRESVLKNISGD
jgi:hypothetical protein